jgi:TPR repeat protein
MNTASLSKVDKHVRLLEGLGRIHRSKLNDMEESKRWYRAAASMMSAAASTGAPEPNRPEHQKYVDLLLTLAQLYELKLEDPEAAVPWLQKAARHGHTYAQKRLTDKGLRW